MQRIKIISTGNGSDRLAEYVNDFIERQLKTEFETWVLAGPVATSSDGYLFATLVYEEKGQE